MKAEKITELIGNTPIVRINGFDDSLKLYAKLEYFNPFSSAKDRIAYYLLKTALENGEIDKDTLIIEPTSGNTGIALAAVSSTLSLKCTIVMPESMSRERCALIKAFGADLVLTRGEDGMAGSIKEAERIKERVGNAYILGQFTNPLCREAHYKTTGPEILRDLPEVDILVATIGTGGTISGSGRYLKDHKDGVRIIGVEPYESPLLTKGYSAPHKIQGIGANFIPSVLDRELLDEVRTCKGDDAIAMSREMMKRSGIFAGISSGASAAVALEVAKENPDKTVLCILTDTAERYISSELFLK